MDYSRYQHLLVEVAGAVATVTINRPEVFNATNDVLHRELTTIWRDLAEDPEVRVAIVTGAGDQAFSAGGTSVTSGRERSSPHRSASKP